MSAVSRHSIQLQTEYSELKRMAGEQPFLLIGSPGAIQERVNSGERYLYRQYYDATGKKAAQYLGTAGTAAGQAVAASVREQIGHANGLLELARRLAQQGYVRADRRASAVLASLANHGLFRGGALLVGSHAYGALLNELGVRAGAHATEDLDIARFKTIDIALEPKVAFSTMLKDSGVELLEVPAMDARKPSTSFKAKGKADRFRVDLLIPGRGAGAATREVPELNAHATALPFLEYLFARPLNAIVIGFESIVPVKVPRAERFAWHKMLVSQLRHETADKREKDLAQATVLFAVLAEQAPDSLARAFKELPRGSKEKVRRAARLVRLRLEKAGDARAVDTMRDCLA